MLGWHVVRDDRAEGEKVEAAVSVGLGTNNLERRDPCLGKRRRYLAERKILLECHRVELMNPVRHSRTRCNSRSPTAFDESIRCHESL